MARSRIAINVATGEQTAVAFTKEEEDAADALAATLALARETPKRETLPEVLANGSVEEKLEVVIRELVSIKRKIGLE